MHGTPSLFDALREVPAWAGDITLKDYKTFLTLVDAELTRRGFAPYQFDDGVIVRLSPAHKGERFGLQNLVAVCRNDPQSRWPDEITAYFTAMDRSVVDVPTLLARASDLAAVRGLLRVRLHAPEAPALPGGEGVVHKVIVPGIRGVLVFDLGSAVVSVMPDHAKGWGVSFDALLASALTNVGAEVKVEQQVIDADPKRAVVTLWGSSNSASSHALLLDRHLDARNTLGALVVVPARHGVVYHPIRDRSAVDMTGHLLDLAAMMYSREPGPISRELYWWHAGRLVHLPTERRGQRVALRAPDEFITTVLGATGGMKH